MVFTSPKWVPQLPIDPPDTITIAEFMSNEKYGRYPIAEARNPYTCGLSGKSYTASEVKQRTDYMARALSKKLDFAPNEGTEWDKVIALFSLNTIDYIPFTHAIHRLSGIVTPASAAYSAQELEHQLRSSNAKALFTCIPLLETALKAAKAVNLPNDRIFLLPVPGVSQKTPYITLDDLVEEGKSLPEVEPLKWVKGQGARQVAYLCYSSGTSGLPKAVMISHRNVIANVLQFTTYEIVPRKELGIKTQAVLGLLPFSHIYGLVVIAHCGTWRGDSVIVLPKFELKQFLETVQRFKINCLAVVPPIIIQVIRNPELCKKYDLTCVRFVYTGAAPLGAETVEDLKKQYPKWHVGQGYGMTETSTVVCTTSEIDIDVGSSGSLVPGARGKIVDPTTGEEITEYNKPGELLVQSPSVVLGYLHNERANAETFVWYDDGRWIRTGDEVLVRKSAAGNEHLVIVDRIKELIKVKGHQVAPAELEAHILTHPAVSDTAVIQVPDERAGEVPKAYVVRATGHASRPEAEVAADICKYVEEHKARHKWLKGGVEFVDVIPKSPSGKILRRLLRDREKEARRASGAKL
ncbi:AMP-binding enzyme [Colletotrichum graminicola]|uniref:AMP-binding enzyme n=1 Tax=Colletotrichum graminicola (strain M1.001 / M2 / FGSC 10212) TaxID=645133 RepID=E3Q6W6_COLGM|nr:AMP-binding enzyme [Colletotrichum graminicola M1.001]EFQ26604.1 AMP-binding enzyme [Colletotrichum graminicola M1.001]WDK17914.1 AMP-binding enzyme [Colletotrichum graminicola]